MHRVVVLSACMVVLLAVCISSFATADNSFAVKSGDYVQWKMTFINTPTRGNITASRMDISYAEDEIAAVRFTIFYANGSVRTVGNSINLLRGALIDDEIVPRNLNVGDQFYDQYVGKITISSLENMRIGGAMRTVMTATMHNTTFVWDRQTGVLVNSTSTYHHIINNTDVLGYVYTELESTNIWQPDILGLNPTILGLNPTVFFTIVTGVIVGGAVAAVLFVVRRIRHAH
jgi:hypothetical protein